MSTRTQRTETKLRQTIANLKKQIETRDASTQRPVLERKIESLKNENSKLASDLSRSMAQIESLEEDAYEAEQSAAVTATDPIR